MTGKSLLIGGVAAFALASGGALAAPEASFGPDPKLPAPNLDHAPENRPTVVGWRTGAKPTVADGFTVEAFASGLDYPRWMLVMDNGDVLVAEARTEEEGEISADRSKGPSANRVTLLRDVDKDGVAEERHVLLSDLKQPFGLAMHGGQLYVGNTDAVMRYPYKVGETKIEGKGEKVMDLPAGGYNNHWTRNIMPSPDGQTLFVTVGSASNVGEHGLEEEKGRAAIHALDPKTGEHRLFASGLRNPNGIDFEPESGLLWAAVNERDKIGDDLVPDYITSVKDGAFYGWPFSYWGKNPDPRIADKGPEMVEKAIAPDYALGSHTAAMDVKFVRGETWPEGWRGGALVSQHGSWNRGEMAGYKVLYVPFQGGKPDGMPKDLLTGFVSEPEKFEVYGRPTGLAFLADGSLLVADDAADTIWRVKPK